MTYRWMWGQKQSAMIAEAHLLNFVEYNDEFNYAEGVVDVIREHDNGNSYIYFAEDSLTDAGRNGHKYLAKQKTKAVFARIERMLKEFHDFIRNLRNSKYQNLENNALLCLFREYRRQMILMQKLFRTSEPFSTAMIEEKIQETVDIEQFSVLITATELAMTQQELEDWLVLCTSAVSEEKLLSHALKYPSNFPNAWDYQEIVDYLQQRMHEQDVNALKKEVQEIHSFKEEVKNKQEQVYKQFPHLKFYAETLQKLSLTRFQIKHAWCGMETLCLDFLQEIAKRIGIDFPVFMESYNFTDTIAFLEKGKKLTDKEIDQRRTYSILHFKNNTIKSKFGDDASEYFGDLYKKGKVLSSLQGQSANPGKARGRVRIITVEDANTFAEDLKRFQDDEILVTTMTSPIMGPLAAKAAAIVTNEGGICSHAAVLAREFRIPCIVGTHDATRVLTDGQEIEVDADTGRVHLL